MAAAISLSTTVAIFARYQVKSWTTDEGMPQNTVFSFVQTPDGYLWMTTLDGLVRFDGVRFTIFNKNNTPGIESNRFKKLILDASGDLWASAETNYVVRYHAKRFQSFTFKTENPTSDLKQAFLIKNLFLDRQSRIAAFTDAGIFEWDGEEFKPYSPVAGETKDDFILSGSNGKFWYSDGAKIFELESSQAHEYEIASSKIVYINGIFEDRSGRVWIGTQNAGLYFIENQRLLKFDLPDQELTVRMQDSDGNLWLAAVNGAVIIAPDFRVSRLTVADGLSENMIGGIFQDREKNIWLGTVHRGLNRLSRQTVDFYSSADGLAANTVTAIYQNAESGDIWLGGGGLTAYREGVFKKAVGNSQFGAEVTAIYRDRQKRLWFGNFGTAYYFENGRYVDFLDTFGLKAAVYDISEDRHGTMWFATDRGLFRWQNESMTRLTKGDGLAGDDVKVIHESADGTLWFGTYGGLSRLKDDVLTSFTAADGLAGNQIRAIYEDSDATLWIGSYDGGLTRLKNGKFTIYNSRSGLFNDGVFCILEDQADNFWMSSNRGIYRVSKSQLNDFADGKISRIESIAYSKEDGLLETECNGGQQPAGLKAADGKLWFPTQRGVAVIDPQKITANPIPPPVVIETIKIDDVSSEPPAGDNSEIIVGPNQTNLEITYTGLSFVKPEFVKFRYKLENLQSDWVEADSRRTSYYSYLPPGEYIFKVIAANSDGVWNTTGATVKIVVLPPYYRTWWFWLVVLLIGISAIYFYHRRRVARLEREKSAQQFFSRQLIESQESERKRIAAELHDGLGQSLAVIKNRALRGLNAPENRERLLSQMAEISEATSAAITEVRGIAQNLHPYQLEFLGLTVALKTMIEKLDEALPIAFREEIEDLGSELTKEAEINLYRIVQEGLNNAVKHSGAKTIDVILRKNEAAIDLLIEDDGTGFIPGEKIGKAGMGLKSIRERAEIINATCEIRSTAGQGTMIHLQIKLK